MRALLAIVLYGLAALAGLAAGYYATAPGSLSERARAREEHRAYRAVLDQEFSKMDAAAAFLAQEEKRAEAERSSTHSVLSHRSFGGGSSR